MPPPWQTGIVRSIIQESPNTRRFLVAAQDEPVFEFKAGQFVTLDLPIHEKPARRMRSYSISSSPDKTSEFELLISLLPGGSGTEYLFREIHPGSRLSFRGPLGTFTLPPKIDRDLFMICTGTGIAPFRSMIRYLLRKSIPYHQIYLLFGCRRQQDLLYHEEFRELANKHPKFHYLPTLSREDWKGLKGYVHPVYENICQQNRKATGDLLPAYFFLCGWKNMITEAKARIVALGYEKKDIHQELYG